MDDEKKVYSFSSEELREAEELNARADTRMTEEYKQFLEEHFGGEGELYNEHLDRNNSCADHVFSGEYVNRDDGDEELYEEHTDENESGEYSEDGFTRSFGDEYVSNRYEPSTSGSFVMDSDSEDEYDSVDSDFE